MEPHLCLKMLLLSAGIGPKIPRSADQRLTHPAFIAPVYKESQENYLKIHGYTIMCFSRIFKRDNVFDFVFASLKRNPN